MNIPRPFAVVLVTACSLVLSSSSAFAADEPETATLPDSAGDDAQISGTLPDSRAGAVTLQRLTGDPSVTYGALPSAGFQSVFGDQYWNGNFWRLNAFVPYNLNPGTDYLFTHVMGGTTQYGGKGIGSFGAGYAYYSEGWDRLLRSTFYIDVDGQPARTQAQAALHLENLGRYIDFRSDIGIVFTDTTNTLFQGLTGKSSFMGNMLFFNARRVAQTSFSHANFEVGGPLAFLGQYGLNAYGQAYYLFNPDASRDALGGRFRAEWTFTEDISLNVYHSYDRIFKDNTWLNLVLTTPDGPPRHMLSQVPVRERFSKRPIRSGRIPTIRDVSNPSLKAINPKTGQAYVVGHINPNASGNGNGTFEHPYRSVAAYQNANSNSSPYDIIYVRPNQTSPGMNLAAGGNGLILFNNQMLFGSTIDHTIPIVPVPGLAPGNVATIGALDPGMPLPLLTNSNVAPSSVIVAANGDRIGGLHIDGSNVHVGISADGNSIVGDNIDDGFIRMITVTDNEFTNNTTGIQIADLSNGMPMPGMPIWSSLVGNTFDNNGVGFDITLDTTVDPVNVDTVGSTALTMVVRDNIVQNSTTDGGRIIAKGPGATIDMTGATVATDFNGDGTNDSAFAGNRFRNNGGSGMVLGANLGGQMAVNVGNLPGGGGSPGSGAPPSNIFTGNGVAGLQVNATSSDSNGMPSAISGTIIGNSFNDPADGGDGLQLLATGDTNTLAFVDFGSTAGDPNQAPVLSAANSQLGTFNGVIDRNTFDRQNSGDDGIFIRLQNASGDFNVTRSTFIGGNANGGIGIDAQFSALAAPNGNAHSQMLMTIGDGNIKRGNLFDANRDAAIAFRGRGFIGNPPAALDRSFVQISNNVIQNTTDDPSTSNFDDPTGDGIFIQREDTSLFTAVIGDGIANNGINGNMIQNNVGAGIHFVSGNGTDQASSTGNLSTLVYFDDNVIDSNANGFRADLFADTTVQVFGVTNRITNSALTAIDINTANNASFGLPAQPVSGEDTNGDGILQPWEDLNFNGQLDTVGPTVLSSVFDSNLIQGFGVDGIWMTAINGSFQDVRISSTQISNPLDPYSNIRTLIDGQGGTSFDGIHIDASGSQSVFMSRPSVWTVQGVDIRNIATNDGILVNSTTGNNIFNFGGPAAAQNVTVFGSGNNGLEINAGGVANDFFYINSLQSNNNNGDGAHIVQTGVNTLLFNLTQSTFNNNRGVGLSADNRSLSTSVYNIGNEDRDFVNGVIDAPNEDTNHNGLLDPGEDTNGNGILDSGEDVNNDGMLGNVGNEFNNNDFQGIFFQTLSPLTGDNNVAGFFDSGDALSPPFPSGTATQNIQGTNDNGDVFYQLVDPTTGQLISELGLYASPNNTRVNVFSRLNFYGNQVLSNGTPLSQADGMVLSVGTNTRMAATINQNTFGGNSLDDLHVITVVSQNPNASQNNIVQNVDRLRYDPVAFLDLAFGENFAVNPPRAFGVDSPTGPGNNVGESIFIETVGHNTSVVGRTETGVFTNSDIVKPAGRNALGVYAIYTTGGTGDINAGNTLSQQPVPSALFTGANVTIPGAPFRTTTAGNTIDPVVLPQFPYTSATGQFNTINFLNQPFP